MDDRDLFSAAGEAIYGPRWKPDMALALAVDERSLRRWQQTGVIPKGVWREVHDLLAEREAALISLRVQIRAKASAAD